MRQSTEIRKEQIKEAVLSLVYNEGIKCFTVKKLAKAIGLSEAGIFRHYSSKKEILLDILSDVETKLVQDLNKIIEKPLSSKKQLQQIICSTISFMIQHNGINVLMLSECAVNNHIDLKTKLAQIYANQRSIVESVVSKGVERGEFHETVDPVAFSMLYMGIPIAINVELMLNPANFDNTTFCEKMQHILLNNCTLEK